MDTKTGWTTIMYGVRGDPIDDSQAGAADTDIVGDASHGSLYTMFDNNGTATTTDDTLLFRMRIGNPTSPTNFAGVGIVGMDANGDGKVDLFMAIDGRNNTRATLLLDPGTQANISPSTTSTSLLPTGWLPNNGIYPFNSTNYLVARVTSANDPHWNSDSDLDDDGKQDAFVTWRIPMPDMATVLAKPSPVDKSGNYGARGATGIQGYDQNTIVRYVNFTQTQHGPINGDLNGIGPSYDRNATFASLGAFTAPMSAANPVSASDKVTITKPVDVNGYINAAEDDAFAVSGTAPANGWVKLTISDADGGTADVVVWVQADGTGAWTASGLNLSGLAEGTLTFTADLVIGTGSSTIVSGATSDTTTAIHDTVPPTVAVDALATAGKPVISGASTDIPTGSTITVSIDPNGDGNLSDLVTYTALVGAGGAWTVDTASVSPTTGSMPGSGLTAYARVTADGTDAAGNPATTALAITKPTVRPQSTNDTTPAIVGTWGGSNGGTDTLSVTVNGVTYPEGANLIVSGTSWTLTIPGGNALSTAGSPYSVTATTTRGTASADDPTTAELQIVAGPAIAITSSSSQSTTKPTITGTSTVSSGFITLVIDPNNDGNPADAITYSVPTDAGGNWSLNTATAQPLLGTYPIAGITGTMDVTATATDSNGAQAVANQDLTVTIRTLSLTTISATSAADATGTINNADTYINRREDDAITVSGSSTNAVGLTVTVTAADNDSGTTNPSGTGTIQADGSWSVTGLNLSALRDGYLTFTATITGASATNTAYIHDATVPQIRFTTASTIDKNGNAAGGAVSGSSDLIAGSQITVLVGSESGTATVAANGDWSYTHTGTLSGSSTSATATPNAAGTDLAGNKPAAAITRSFDLAASLTLASNAIVISTIAGDNVIVDAEAPSVVISGTSTLANGTTVSVTITKSDGTAIAGPITTTVSGGNWSIAAQNLSTVTPNGTLVVTATATSTYTYTDVALPILRLGSVGSGSPPTVTITSVGDANLSDAEDNSVTISGTTTSVTDGGTVSLTVSDTDGVTANVLGTATVTGGAWTTTVPLNLSTLIDGTLTIGASVTANSQTATDSAVVNHDTVPPLLTFTSGPIAGNATPTISGTTDLSAGATLTLTIDADANGSTDVTYHAIVQAGGTWSVDTATATPYASTFPASGLSAISKATVSGTDPAGNSSTLIATSIVAITNDTGVSSQDFLTNDPTLIFTGKAEPSSSVEVKIGAVSIGTTVTNGSGNWTLDYTGTSLAAGTYTLTAIATKAPGFTATATQSFTVDLTGPAVAITSISDDTGTAGDFRTKDAELIFNGTADNGSSVLVTLKDAGNNVVFTATVSPTAGAWSVDRTSSALADGTYSLTATATDAAGNTATATQSVVVDTTAIIAITTNAKTSDDTPLITGTTDIETGRTITIEIDPNNDGDYSDAHIYTTTVQAGGTWSVVATTPLSGTVGIKASGTDANGNLAVATKPLTIDLDAPTITISEPIGDGDLNATEDDAVIISGITTFVPEDGVIQVTITDGSLTISDSTTAAADGSWSLSPINLSSMANGVLTVSATYVDDTGTPYSDLATVLHNKAGMVSIDSISIDTGIISDFITSDNTLIFYGSAGANAAVNLTLTGSSGTVFTTVVTANSSGVWSYDYTGSILPDGTYTLAADTASQVVVVNTGTPAGPVTVDAQTTADTTPVITGTATVGAGETLTVTVNGITYTDGDGHLSLTGTNWTLTIPVSDALIPASADGDFDGVYDVTAVIKNAAGGVLADATSGELTISDSTAPVVDLAPADGSTLNYSVTSNEGALVSVDDDSNAATVVEAGDKITRINIAVAGLLDGADEKLIFGATTVAANGTSGTKNDITVGGVRVNLTHVGSAFSLQKFNYTDLTAAEAQAVVRNIQYQNLATVTAGARTFTFTATDAAGNVSTGAVATVNVAATRTAQHICFCPPAKASRYEPVTLTATASSGLPVTFAVTSGPGSVAGNILTFSGAGSVVVTASQAGDGSYFAAPDKTETIQVIDFYIPSSVADGWTVTYGGEDDLLVDRNSEGKAMAMQVLGNYAVSLALTGSTTNAAGDRDIYTAKYDAASGEKLWSVIHGGAAAGADEGSAVAMDSTGNVWVTGMVSNGDKNTDIYVAKYAAADGSLLWEQTFRGADGTTDAGNDGPGGYAAASRYQGGDFKRNAIALTPDGGVVITGYVTKADKKMDAVTLKYDSDGDLAWSGTFNGTAGGTDYGQSVAVDSAGDVFVSGASVNATLDAITLKYNGATGARVWDKTYDGGKPDAAVNIKIDADGHAVISGYSQRATFDFLTARYDSSDGSLIWMNLLDGPANSSDMAWDFALTDGTRPIVTGTSYPSNGVYDGYIFTYNCPCSTDPVAWAKRYDGPAGKLDQFLAIGTDMFGNPVVTGYSQNANGTNDVQTVKYAAADGTILWQKRYNGTANGDDIPRQVLVDPAGNVFITGFTTETGGATKSWITRYVATEPASATAQVITFLTPPTQGVADSLTLMASASSGLPVEYEVVSGPATIEDGVVTFSGMGTVTIRASQPGDGAHDPATPVERTFTVGKSRQVIIFELPATAVGADAIALEAEASSGLAITYTVVSGPANLDGDSLIPTGTGNVTIRASQAGDSQYLAATSVEQTISVTPGSQTLAFTLPAAAVTTDVLTLGATASSSLPVTYTVVSGPGVISGSSLSFTGAGSVSIRASQTGDELHNSATAVTKTVSVKKATQTIIFDLAETADITGSITLAATASSGLPVTYTVTGPGAISGGILTFTGSGKVTVRANQSGSGMYYAALAVAKTVTVSLVRPILASVTLEDAYVGELVSTNLSATRNPAKYTATGLPAGVTLNATTGVITGRPTKANVVSGEVLPYTVTFTASNAAGSSNTVTALWTILPLPSSLVGTFNGLVEASSELSLNNTVNFTGLGGAVSVATTQTGSYTGKIVIDTVGYALSGKLSVADDEATGSCVIVRKNAPSLTVSFRIDSATGKLTGTITDGRLTGPVAVTAWRNCWNATSHPATAYAGAYTAALEIAAELQGSPLYPQGNGFGTLKVTTAGIASWSGKLADGTTTTASACVGPQGQVPLHIPLYTPTVVATAGAANGWMAIDAAHGNALEGSLHWKKNPQASSSTSRNYKQGFPSHEITVLGGKYLGTPIVLPPAESSTEANTVLTFSDGGIENASYTQSTNGQLHQAFRLTNGRTVSMPTSLSLNPAAVRLSLNATSGLITGSFTLKDADPTDTTPPIAVITRTVTYSGVMVPSLNKGVGHFVLPQLPSISPSTTMSNSPQMSGQVLLEAAISSTVNNP